MYTCRVSEGKPPPVSKPSRIRSRPRGAASVLLERVAAASAFRDRLAAIPRDPASGPVLFAHVAPAAQAFVLALSARAAPTTPTRLWALCCDLRTQERVTNELELWLGYRPLFFPEQETFHFEGAVRDPEITAERLSFLNHLASPPSTQHLLPEILVLNVASLEERVPTPGELRDARLHFRAGDPLDFVSLQEKLAAAGFEAVSQVIARGQFARRGGILDIFTWETPHPVRIELFGDDIESLREFDIDTQTSIGVREEITFLVGEAGATPRHSLREIIDPGADLVVAIECEDPSAQLVITSESDASLPEEDFSTACHESPLGGFEAGDFILQEAKRNFFQEQLAEWKAEAWQVALVFSGAGEQERFEELVEIPPGSTEVLIGQLDQGFTIPGARLSVVSDSEIFGRYHQARARRAFQRDRQRRVSAARMDFVDFSPDDLVVHEEYGIGRFLGLESSNDADGEADDAPEVLVIEYADEARLYVPLNQSHLVSRYVGLGRKAPPLNRLGGAKWQRLRKAAEKSILDYAAQVLSIQAERDSSLGYAHEPDTKWQWEFEGSFPYKETTDQVRAIAESKADMESPRPMDRLICGDVGFGKTEVAIRAAFKAVMGGKQVALLVPTTVLAQQHFQTFRERMSEYPVNIELLSRFRTRGEQTQVAKGLREGSVDNVIGTHRLISKDISFKNLGLVVIDEEQRFGVLHKERFKEMFRLVDVLTLSATPIPRTLYLAMMGARDMSTIDTPPPNRYPVETVICPYDERLIRDAIKRELQRGGQVFFLHNRVHSIERVREKLENLCPDARIAIGHGQMHEDELELVMTRFINGEIDVLVCTTIIESGIDIPNANTIIIDRADRFGLADLYQLRGRVGRAQHKAYALLTLPRDMLTTGDARKRINAIKQYSSLGAGFKIAMRDLEIRGAGNLLGTQQSGHIVAVGFDLYCTLLKQSIARLKGERVPMRIDVAVKLDFVATGEAEYLQVPGNRLPCYIPAAYIEDPRLRIKAYRGVAEATSLEEVEKLAGEWSDRFGPHPAPIRHLLQVTELRVRCAAASISVCEVQGDKLMFTRKGKLILLDGRFPRLSAESFEEKLLEAIRMAKGL